MSTAKFDTWKNTDDTENFKVRAWVNFNGTGTVAIRAAGNVGSVADVGVGDYTINFATALSDANYVAAPMVGNDPSSTTVAFTPDGVAVPTAGAFRLRTLNSSGGTLADATRVFCTFVR